MERISRGARRLLCTVAAEFVGTSITSGGDGNDDPDPRLVENPHVQWRNARRGYVSCQVTGERWETSYQEVPFVTRPGVALITSTRWGLTAGRPGIERL